MAVTENDKNQASRRLKTIAEKLAEKSKKQVYKVSETPCRVEEKEGKEVKVPLNVHKKGSKVILTDTQKVFFEKHGGKYELVKEEPKKVTQITKK